MSDYVIMEHYSFFYKKNIFIVKIHRIIVLLKYIQYCNKQRWDFTRAVNGIQSDILPIGPLRDTISYCRDMLKRNWEVSISHIYEEQNYAANALVDMA